MSKTSQQKRSAYQQGFKDGLTCKKWLNNQYSNCELLIDIDKEWLYKDFRRYIRHPYMGLYKKGFMESLN